MDCVSLFLGALRTEEESYQSLTEAGNSRILSEEGHAGPWVTSRLVEASWTGEDLCLCALVALLHATPVPKCSISLRFLQGSFSSSLR